MPFPVQAKEMWLISQALYFTSYKAIPQILKVKYVQKKKVFLLNSFSCGSPLWLNFKHHRNVLRIILLYLSLFAGSHST